MGTGREWAMATRRPGNLLDDDSCYSAIRLPRAQLRSAVTRIVELQKIALADDANAGGTLGAGGTTVTPN